MPDSVLCRIFNLLKKQKTKEVIKLKELIPDWWGYDRV